MNLGGPHGNAAIAYSLNTTLTLSQSVIVAPSVAPLYYEVDFTGGTATITRPWTVVPESIAGPGRTTRTTNPFLSFSMLSVSATPRGNVVRRAAPGSGVRERIVPCWKAPVLRAAPP